MKNKSPCKNCERRSKACWAKCDDYKKYRADLEEAKNYLKKLKGKEIRIYGGNKRYAATKTYPTCVRVSHINHREVISYDQAYDHLLIFTAF